jgi:hypothetical protein
LALSTGAYDILIDIAAGAVAETYLSMGEPAKARDVFAELVQRAEHDDRLSRWAAHLRRTHERFDAEARLPRDRYTD